MPEILAIITIVLLGVIGVLVMLALTKMSRLSLLEKQSEMQYTETRNALEKLSEQMSRLTEQNYGQQNKMLETVTKTLTDIRDRNQKENDQMREMLQKNLDQMRATVEEKLSKTLSERLDVSFKSVSQQLENVYKSLGEMKELSSGVTDNVKGLNRILTNVKARGTWGEAQLQHILEDIIPSMYDANVSTNPEKPTERVEFAVRIPTGDGGSHVYLPIDSKFPLEDYARMVAASDAGDAQGISEARKALKVRVQDEAKSVSKYIHEPETTSFAILYLATEGLYAEIASDEALVARMRSQHSVMLAGPSTIAALLNSLAMGFRTVAINRKAEEVRQLLVKVKSQYDTFEGLLEQAHKKIEAAGSALDKARHRNSMIQKNLKKVDQLEPLVTGAQEALPGFSELDELNDLSDLDD